VVLALPAAAQAPAAPAAAPAAGANEGASLRAGQQIAGSGAPNGVTACVSCHGAQGEGNPAGGFPRIAGQSAYYLARQMTGFANGSRENPVMTPIAKAMNAQQIRDVSAWYASLGGSPAAGAPGPAAGGGQGGAETERGRVLATRGNESQRIQACTNCHGPGGAGEPPTYPYLAGQHAVYLTAAMAEWKNGMRKTDPSGQMPAIARALGDADVAALSAYFASLPAPTAASQMVNIPAGSSARPAIAARADAPGPKGPAASSGAVQGTGTEQGAPLTGGGQGPGGGGGTSGTQPQSQPQPPATAPRPPGK
jgi:cytochrome c553